MWILHTPLDSLSGSFLLLDVATQDESCISVACSSADCRALSFGFDSFSVLLISIFCHPPHQSFQDVLQAVNYELQGSHQGEDALEALHVINFNTGCWNNGDARQ
jgi:hypothetical protein